MYEDKRQKKALKKNKMWRKWEVNRMKLEEGSGKDRMKREKHGIF